jgi:cell division septal protein FtsQ
MIDNEEPAAIDLSALDPELPPSEFERRLAKVRSAANGALARRRAGGTAFVVVARWRAPLLAALFLVMFISVALLRSARSDVRAEAESQIATDEIADALGLSSPLGMVLLSDTTSAADLLLGGFDP